uniref:Uncharacterized protein n=1 Tax=Romanomermis culicivorax TaxID=13658 RepID=A0A915IDG5_ROMCU
MSTIMCLLAYQPNGMNYFGFGILIGAKGQRPRRQCLLTSSDRKTFKGILQFTIKFADALITVTRDAGNIFQMRGARRNIKGRGVQQPKKPEKVREKVVPGKPGKSKTDLISVVSTKFIKNG